MPYSSNDPSAFIGIGMQSALGSPQATQTKMRFAKYLSGTSFKPDAETVSLREGGDGMDPGFTYKKSQKTSGQLVLNARPDVLGLVLALAIGGATWDGASLPAGHTFHTGHASFPWGTLVSQHPASAMIHHLADARFGGLTLEFAPGEPIKVTSPFTVISHGASFASVTPTYIVETPFLYAGGSYYVDGGLASGITGWKVDLGYSLEELQANAITLDEIVVQNRDITLEWTRRFEDALLWKRIYMGATTGIVPTSSVPTGAFRGVVAAAPSALLDVNLPLLSYLSHDIGELDPDGKTVIETVTAKALKGATHSLFIKLNNAHASAYSS